MKKIVLEGQIVNGFKIIKELGRIRLTNKNKYLWVECKECKKEFETSATSIKKIKSCGCKPIKVTADLKKEINGFKILKDLGYSNGSRRCISICKVCGKKYEVDPNKLQYRKHCGCLKKGTKISKYAKTHRRLLNIYFHMRQRCYQKDNQDYYLYGERGIKICDEWLTHVDVFCEWALANGYEDSLTIDRINSKGDYKPTNCRWADPATQARNTSRNVLTMELADRMRMDGEFMTVIELSLKYNVSIGTVQNVLRNKSWY